MEAVNRKKKEKKSASPRNIQENQPDSVQDESGQASSHEITFVESLDEEETQPEEQHGGVSLTGIQTPPPSADEENTSPAPNEMENTVETLDHDGSPEEEFVDLNELLGEFSAVKDDPAAPETDPNIFDQPDKFDKIVQLRTEMERPRVESYLTGFETAITDDALMVGAISLDDVQVEERRLREEHLAFVAQEKERARKLREELYISKEEVKRQLANDFREKRLQLQRQQEMLEQMKRLAQDQLQRSFRQSEENLIQTLENRKGQVKTMYGDLQSVGGMFDGVDGRRWKVDWNSTPQPIQVKLITVRGVRDKIPKGRYVLLTSLYNRLGGQPLRWSNMKGQYWGGATVPTRHSGNFSSTELKMDQSVFTVLPAQPEVRPGMVLCFELFLLRGEVTPVDTVVSWGAFPICNADFDIIEGKYKIPMLRGFMDTSIDRHEKIEQLISWDIDNWLANLYIEVIRLPRYQSGEKEYEVELQFSSGLLNYPDRVGALAEACRDGEDPKWDKTDAVMSATAAGPDLSDGESGEKTSLSGSDSQYMSASTSGVYERKSDDFKVKHRLKAGPLPVKRTADLEHSFVSSRASLMREKTGPDTALAPLETLYALGEEDETKFRPVLGQPGIYYKHYRKSVRDDYLSAVNSLLPKTPEMRPPRQIRRSKASRLQELETYHFAIRQPTDTCGRVPNESSKRLSYVRRMMLAELGFSNWRSSEFWLVMFMLVFSFFLRMYLHYCGQWIFLTLSGIPVNIFTFHAHTVNLNYQPTLLTTAQEITVVVLGPLFDIVVFALLMLICLISLLVLKSFPDLCSKFLLAFGIMTLLDPLLILIVDLGLTRYINYGAGRPIADAAKLYYHFYLLEGSGGPGIVLTLILYILIFTVSLIFLYVYFLRLHNEGRMLDIYWRLHGEEENFFLPYDLEVSPYELAYVVRRGEQWRGEEGERRKITVTDYVWEEEPLDDDVGPSGKSESHVKVEVTTHVAVHTLHLDGLKELYRHFLRLPDGAIIEVFGDNIGFSGMDEDLKRALAQSAREMDPIDEKKTLPEMTELEVVVVADDEPKKDDKTKKDGDESPDKTPPRKRKKRKSHKKSE